VRAAQHALVIGLAETGASVTRRLGAEGWHLTVMEDAPAGTDRYRARVDAIRAADAELVEVPDAETTRALA